MKNFFLCSFASDDLYRSKTRFIKQASEMNIYEDIKVFKFADLNKDKKEQINLFLNKGNKRLFGYACWKPDIVLSYLDKLPENSILQYSDIGCVFNPRGKSRLRQYVEITEDMEILTFSYSQPDNDFNQNFKYQIYKEYQYTKADLSSYLGIHDDSQILKTEQIWSGTMFFKNNLFTKKILNEWSAICKINDLIDDSNSKIINDKDFIEHRHDQSAFSLICKKNNIFHLSVSECEWAEFQNNRTWVHLKNYPILAMRDKKKNFFKRFISRQKKNINRLFKI